jgi:hypothetical protein
VHFDYYMTDERAELPLTWKSVDVGQLTFRVIGGAPDAIAQQTAQVPTDRA